MLELISEEKKIETLALLSLRRITRSGYSALVCAYSFFCHASILRMKCSIIVAVYWPIDYNDLSITSTWLVLFLSRRPRINHYSLDEEEKKKFSSLYTLMCSSFSFLLEKKKILYVQLPCDPAIPQHWYEYIHTYPIKPVSV